jgi:membrane protein
LSDPGWTVIEIEDHCGGLPQGDTQELFKPATRTPTRDVRGSVAAYRLLLKPVAARSDPDTQYTPMFMSDGLGKECLESDHGRAARRPKEIPREGWLDILVRVWEKIGEDSASLIAAGIALNALLAFFPALAVTVAIYGLFSSPLAVATEMNSFMSVLPADAARVLQDQLQSLVSPEHTHLGVGAVLGALLAFWSARQGMVALMTATNIAYYQRERRSYLKQVGLSLVFTLAALVAFLIILLLGVAVPLALKVLPLGPVAAGTILVFRWVLLWSFVVVALTVVYRYAPDRKRAQWRWVTWGSAVAATLWLIGSALFELYLRHFNSYGLTYGALGGMIVLIIWFYLGSFAVVLGAEINAEMEHQTAVDTTQGPAVPMGQRGAYVADTLGKARE